MLQMKIDIMNHKLVLVGCQNAEWKAKKQMESKYAKQTLIIIRK